MKFQEIAALVLLIGGMLVVMTTGLVWAWDYYSPDKPKRKSK